MAKRTRHQLRILWISLMLILPLVYLCHAVPHSHAAETHTPAPAAPVSHSDHGHSHSHSHTHDDHATEVPQDTHHHSLNNHLDSHPVRLYERGSSPDQDQSVAATAATPWIHELTNPELAPDRDEYTPGTAPPLIHGSRAPPLQG